MLEVDSAMSDSNDEKLSFYCARKNRIKSSFCRNLYLTPLTQYRNLVGHNGNLK